LYPAYGHKWLTLLSSHSSHPLSVGITTTLASRLIPKHYFQNNPETFAQALRDGQVQLGESASDQPIQILADCPPPQLDTGDTSVNKVWYHSLWHTIYSATWPTNTTAPVIREKMRALNAAADELRKFAPDGGVYINEAYVFEQNHEQAFWGDNAARLYEIKSIYDPSNIFQGWQTVGWDSNDPIYSCYAALDPSASN